MNQKVKSLLTQLFPHHNSSHQCKQNLNLSISCFIILSFVSTTPRHKLLTLRQSLSRSKLEGTVHPVSWLWLKASEELTFVMTTLYLVANSFGAQVLGSRHPPFYDQALRSGCWIDQTGSETELGDSNLHLEPAWPWICRHVACFGWKIYWIVIRSNLGYPLFLQHPHEMP